MNAFFFFFIYDFPRFFLFYVEIVAIQDSLMPLLWVKYKNTSMKKSLRRVAILLVAIIAVSCTKEGDDTIVLPSPARQIPFSVIADDLQDSLAAHGFVINEGTNPPVIDGYYLIQPLTISYASDGYVNAFHDLYMNFSNQNNRGLLQYAERQRDTVEGQSIAARVIGHDNKFTMYCYQETSEYSGSTVLWRCKSVTVASGELTPTGIADCQYAIIILDEEAINDYYYSLLAPVGTYRIFYDGDSLAVKIR